MNQNADREVLLALLRGESVAAVTPAQWQAIAVLARRHRVTALLYERLKAYQAQVPAGILQTTRLEYLQTADRNMRLYHFLAGILERFSHEHIPVIPLKGAFLAQNIYGNIAVRPMGDVDLLVKMPDLRRAGDILLNLGYTRTDSLDMPVNEAHHFGYKCPKTGLYVEVHWNLIASVYGIHVDIEPLWERSRPALVESIPVREMSPEDQVLHLCVHASNHVFRQGLLPMCDLAETLQRYQGEMDWDCLFQRAQQWGAERCAHVNLRLAQELLHAPVPDRWLDSANLQDFDEHYMSLAGEQLFMSGEEPEAKEPGRTLPEGLVQVWVEKGVTGKFVRLWQSIFLSRQSMEANYPEAHLESWRILLYYPRRIKYLLEKYLWTALSLMIGERQMVACAKRIVARAERQSQLDALRNWLLLRHPPTS